jgi:hypothetical protein
MPPVGVEQQVDLVGAKQRAFNGHGPSHSLYTNRTNRLLHCLQVRV